MDHCFLALNKDARAHLIEKCINRRKRVWDAYKRFHDIDSEDDHRQQSECTDANILKAWAKKLKTTETL